VIRENPISATELNIITQNIDQTNQSTPSIKIELGWIIEYS
jgi:NAD-dependent SIR2 family protein deacetylase